MIDASQIKAALDPKTFLAKVLAWVVVLPSVYYLVSFNGRIIGVLKESPDGIWEFQPSREQEPAIARADFASPAAFLNHCKETGFIVRLDHVPFPG